MILRTILNPILELLLGIIIGVITVRVYRRIIIATQQHNVSKTIGYHTAMILISITKLIIAYVSVCYILEIDILHPISAAESKSSNGEDRGMIVSTFEKGVQVVHLLIYTTGIKIGQALQPVGLTGGIATGKSTVSILLQQQSSSRPSSDKKKKDTDEVEFVIIDVDGIAHDILLPTYNDSVYDRLVAEFGTDILMKDKAATTTSHRRPLIDRRKLGDVVFKDRNKRRKLNSITHPKIIKIMIKRILYEGLKGGRRVVCVDIPLLFEGGLPMKLLFGSSIIVVSCNSTLQLQRLQSRNTDLTLDQCKERIASQIPIEKKAKLAHYVIVNNGSLKSLKNEVEEVKLKLIMSYLVVNVVLLNCSG